MDYGSSILEYGLNMLFDSKVNNCNRYKIDCYFGKKFNAELPSMIKEQIIKYRITDNYSDNKINL